MKIKFILNLALILSIPGWAFSFSPLNSVNLDRLKDINTQIKGIKLGSRPEISQVNQTWNLTSMEWSNVTQIMYLYDSETRVSKQETSGWQTDAWAPSDLSIFERDSVGNAVKESIFKFINEGWQLSGQHLRKYDTAGTVIEDIDQFLLKGEWQNRSRTAVTVEGESQLTTKFSWTGSDWRPSEREVYTANSGPSMSRNLTESYLGDEWVPTEQSIYTRNPQGQTTSLLFQNWTDSVWVNNVDLVVSWSKPDDLLEGYDYMIWQNSAWVQDAKMSFTYDADGNETEFLIEVMNNGTLENYERDVKTWSETVTDVRAVNEANHNISFTQGNEGVLIHLGSSNYRSAEVGIYNIMGKPIIKLKPNPKESVVNWDYSSSNGEHVLPGIYFIKVKADALVEQQKILVK